MRPAPVSRPAESDAAQQFRSALYFACGIVGIAVLLFFAVRQTPSAKRLAKESGAAADSTLAAFTAAPDFVTWLGQWQKVDAYVGQSEFTRAEVAALVPTDPFSPPASSLQPPQANRFAWSPDKSKFVDFLSNYGDPDSKLTVFNRAGSAQTETIDFCGTPCRFDSAFWLDDSRAVVLGRAEGTKADGTPLCIGAAGDANKCYSHLTVTVYDFGRATKQRYLSDNHLFASDPMAQTVHDRWISGLSQQEREALGEAPTGESINVRGKIIDLVPSSRILSIATDAGTQRFVTLVPSAVIRGIDGMQGPIEALRKGAAVEVAAIRSADGTVMALSVRVTSEPPAETPPAPTPKKKKSAR